MLLIVVCLLLFLVTGKLKRNLGILGLLQLLRPFVKCYAAVADYVLLQLQSELCCVIVAGGGIACTAVSVIVGDRSRSGYDCYCGRHCVAVAVAGDVAIDGVAAVITVKIVVAAVAVSSSCSCSPITFGCFRLLCCSCRWSSLFLVAAIEATAAVVVVVVVVVAAFVVVLAGAAVVADPISVRMKFIQKSSLKE